MSIKFQNWKSPSRASLTTWTGIVGSVTAFSPEFISFLHQAPFPVSGEVDLWVAWLLKGATVGMSFITIFTRVNQSNEPTSGQN